MGCKLEEDKDMAEKDEVVDVIGCRFRKSLESAVSSPQTFSVL